jgi:parallel beta-helix repeat protein/predicted outer membrane repeat protein
VGSSPIIINCAISGNKAGNDGGGIVCFGSSPTIANCTISGNYAGDEGGAIYCDEESSPMIINCILWNNSPDEIYSENGTCSVTYSDIHGDYDGEGNIDADPLFVGSDMGNYYLMAGSPCIDIGNPTNAPLEDREGVPRPQGSGTDMGAYEYVEPSACMPRASFTANLLAGMNPLTVDFDASSSGGSQYSGVNFSWDFGDASTGSGKTISHTYSDYGCYDVSLTVVTGCGNHQMRIHNLIKIKSSQVTKEVGEGYIYTSIQSAIDDADYGEVILVHDGTYVENIDFNKKGITVCSENGAATTIIDGGANGSTMGFFYKDTTESVLDGFTIQNGLASDGGGIHCYFSSPVIANCTISRNIADYRGIIYCDFSSPTIINCAITDNKANDGGGIYCTERSYPKIINCTISKNDGGGIYCEDEASPIITNCIIWNNSPWKISSDIYPLKITYSDIQQETGIYPGVGNINTDPLFVRSESGNYYLMPNSPCIDTGTSTNAPADDKEGIVRPQGSGIDMGAYEYVEPASCTPRASFTANQTTGTDSLTVEFDASSSGGSQYSGAIFSWDFGDGTSGNGMMISHAYTDYGSYDVSLTITTECGSHRLTLSDFIRIKSSQVTKEVGAGQAYTSIQAAIDDAGYGEMILVHDGTYIENIKFKGKGLTVFSENGAASTIIDGSGSGSVVIFDHCEGIDTVLDGFTLQNGLAPTYYDDYYYGYYDDYSDNVCDGGGIYCRFSSPTIANCIIQNNTARDGGGIYCINYSSPTIINCSINNNTAEDGGGGIYCRSYSSPTIINCTINNNTAEDYGGGIYCSSFSSSPTITNCILWNNLPEEISCNILTVTYSDIKQDTGIHPGEGNINADPLFVGSESGNYYLMLSSPCIDAGTDVNVPSNDIDGISRPQDGDNDGTAKYDMGAYEYVVCIPTTEICDGKDNDCDGQVDEEKCIIYYKDEDNDGQGIDGDSRCLCSPDDLSKYTAIYSGDPDDLDPNIQGTILTGNMSLPAGWSMISLPLIPQNASVSSLFPDAVVVYCCEKGMGYERIKEEESVEVGKGHWILINEAKTYSITGEIIDEYDLSVQDGWYMIGGCTYAAQASIDDGKIKVIYDYKQGVGYQRILESEKLKPGEGYWILFEEVTDQASLSVKGIME